MSGLQTCRHHGPLQHVQAMREVPHGLAGILGEALRAAKRTTCIILSLMNAVLPVLVLTLQHQLQDLNVTLRGLDSQVEELDTTQVRHAGHVHTLLAACDVYVRSDDVSVEWPHSYNMHARCLLLENCRAAVQQGTAES